MTWGVSCHKFHVVLYTPGRAFVVDEWNVDEALRRVSEEVGSFQFRTYLTADPIPDGEGGLLEVEKKEVDRSGTYFVRGSLLTYDEVSDSHEDFKRMMRLKENWVVVIASLIHPFRENDFIIEPVDGKAVITARGDDPKLVAYRKKMTNRKQQNHD